MSSPSHKPTRPRRLVPGDLIGVAAPAGIVEREPFEAGIRVMETLGFRIRVEQEVFLRTGYLAGADHMRANSINALIRDPQVKAIVCARGGYGCMRILPLIDYGALRNQPKAIVGFSDITALLVAIYAECGLATFHGPVVTSLSTADDATIEALGRLLTGDQTVKLVSSDGPVIAPGVCQGPVLAGNLTLLCHLIGTPFANSFKGHILLIEDCGEALYRIDRMLTHLHLAGCLDHVAGIALGLFKDCGAADRLNDLFFERLSRLGIPVLAGFQVGHGHRNLPLPIGLQATLDTDAGALAFDSAATCQS